MVMLGMLIGTPAMGSSSGTGGYDAPYLQANNVQSLTDYTSGLVNPALLSYVNQMHLEAGFYRWNIAADGGAMGYQQLSFLYPLGLNQTLGLSIIGVSTSVDSTTVDGDRISPAGISVGFGDMWFVGHYSIKLMPWLSIGGNLKFRDVKQFSEGDAWGVGGDVGAYFNPIDNRTLGNLGFSINLQDVVPAIVTWKNADSSNKEVAVTRIRAGARYEGLENTLVVDGEAIIDNALGKTWSSSGVDKIAWRGSINAKWQFVPWLWIKGGWSNNNVPYIGFNYNLMYPLADMINYVQYDFHFGYSVTDKDRGITLMNRLSADFGSTREQSTSQSTYDQLIVAPTDAYDEAMRLYSAGKYWEATFAFGKIVSLYPNFYLNDKAEYYLGDCYLKLHMFSTAREILKAAAEEYPTSSVGPLYAYGLENIAYLDGKYDDVLKQYAIISNVYAASDIVPDADYLAGESHYIRKNYVTAEQVFNRLKPADASYIYAQYTLSVINIENKNIDAAIQNLMTIAADTTPGAQAQLIRDAANTKLGHLYFDQMELRNAVEAYKRVSEGSVYGDEALLGMAWVWMKGNQTSVCMQIIEQLLQLYPQSPLLPEAYLLKGYGLMMMKNYADAIAVLNKSIELAKGTYITDADVLAKQQEYDTMLQAFTSTAEKIRKNALRKPVNKTLEERTALRGDYDTFAKAYQDYFDYMLRAKSHKRFIERKDEVIQDAEYALAKSTTILKGKQQAEQLEKSKLEQKKIDEQIKKLQDQLKDQTNK